jgi:hypothetical protein
MYASPIVEKKINQFIAEICSRDERIRLVELLNDLAVNAADLGFDDGAHAEEYAREAAMERNCEPR